MITNQIYLKFIRITVLALLAAALFVTACNPARRSTTPTRVKPSKPVLPGRHETIDTIRWTPNTDKPPITGTPTTPATTRPGKSDTYQIGFLLPFLTNQSTPSSPVPDKSRLALQFYSGAKIALEEISTTEKINLVVDFWDTQLSDAEFQALLNTNSRIQKPSVFIGPIRSSHVEIFANWAKPKKKIVISPESPNAGLAHQYPDFIQTNPSLQAHCEAITRYVRRTSKPDAVTLVCRQKEADRLPYFQQYNSTLGGGPFAELVVPDDVNNFDKVNLKRYIKPGKTSVFILPTWSSQDFVMAFLRKLKELKGDNRVEVYGMPQWQYFESIDAEYLLSMNVHISSASWVDYSNQQVKDFQQKFYDATGTLPDDDGFNGYDVTMFTCKMLVKYGLLFPEQVSKETYHGLRNDFVIGKDFSEKNPLETPGSMPMPDYLENKSVHILKFGKSGFAPAE